VQILNIGAGRSDQEYKEAEEQRRAELRSDVQTYAMYFFAAAGLAGLATGLLPVRLGIVVNIGAIDLLTLYGRDLVHAYPLLLPAAGVTWVLVLCALGLAARKGFRWAFWAGVLLYGADMLLLMVTFSLWAVGVHGFFIFEWFKGQRALGELNEPSTSQQKEAAASR
jgi:hypothetical protein